MAKTCNCPFCESNTEITSAGGTVFYNCLRCGHFTIKADLMHLSMLPYLETISEQDKSKICISLRNQWEQSGRKDPNSVTKDRISRILKSYKLLDPLEKMDNALWLLNKQSKRIGSEIGVPYDIDYPWYRCAEAQELTAILNTLESDKFITVTRSGNKYTCIIQSHGYRRLREIQRPNQESRQAFVAMWFNDDTKKTYDDAIEPAIQYVEPGEMESRFKALRIDNKEHINDINDEIIAQIRRSRFMVCDLTGYRGGVYFEAGFAYGLGIPVILTCRKDWTENEVLSDTEGNEIEELYSKDGTPVSVIKQGVHFDLNHRNRIQWEPDKLDEFRQALENRIKAVVY